MKPYYTVQEDVFVDAAQISEIRMVFGGMLGAIGIPITGIGYYRLYQVLMKNESGMMPFLYQLSAFVFISFAGAGGHLPCAVIPMLYKWIAPINEVLAVQVAEKHANYFMLPSMVLFGVPLFVALIYQTVLIHYVFLTHSR